VIHDDLPGRDAGETQQSCRRANLEVLYPLGPQDRRKAILAFFSATQRRRGPAFPRAAKCQGADLRRIGESMKWYTIARAGQKAA
jgi:hypothetical protein